MRNIVCYARKSQNSVRLKRVPSCPAVEIFLVRRCILRCNLYSRLLLLFKAPVFNTVVCCVLFNKAYIVYVPAVRISDIVTSISYFDQIPSVAFGFRFFIEYFFHGSANVTPCISLSVLVPTAQKLIV